MKLILTNKGEELFSLNIKTFKDEPIKFVTALLNAQEMYGALKKLVSLYCHTAIVTSEQINDAWSEAEKVLKSIDNIVS